MNIAEIEIVDWASVMAGLGYDAVVQSQKEKHRCNIALLASQRGAQTFDITFDLVRDTCLDGVLEPRRREPQSLETSK